VRTVTTNQTLNGLGAAVPDYAVLCQPAAPGVALTLPPAGDNTGHVIIVKNLSTTITCQLNGVLAIDGGPNLTLTVAGGATIGGSVAWVVSNGTSWFVLAKS
jgi:hypothetical protein